MIAVASPLGIRRRCDSPNGGDPVDDPEVHHFRLSRRSGVTSLGSNPWTRVAVAVANVQAPIERFLHRRIPAKGCHDPQFDL